MERTLNQLKTSEYGYVSKISVENEKLKHRLIDMGITTGVKVRLVKAAPTDKQEWISSTSMVLNTIS